MTESLWKLPARFVFILYVCVMFGRTSGEHWILTCGCKRFEFRWMNTGVFVSLAMPFYPKIRGKNLSHTHAHTNIYWFYLGFILIFIRLQHYTIRLLPRRCVLCAQFHRDFEYDAVCSFSFWDGIKDKLCAYEKRDQNFVLKRVISTSIQLMFLLSDEICIRVNTWFKTHSLWP